MSRAVQIVVTLVLFTAVMVGLNAALRPATVGIMDWLYARIGVEWSLLLLAAFFVPFGLWGWWHTYREGKAARTRSD